LTPCHEFPYPAQSVVACDDGNTVLPGARCSPQEEIVSTRNDTSALCDHNPQLTQIDCGQQGIQVYSPTRNRFTSGEIWRTLAIEAE